MAEKKRLIPDWIKTGFLKFGNQIVIKSITKLLLRFGLNLWGPIGWVASFFIDKVLVKIWDFGSKLFIKAYFYFTEKKETEKEVTVYEKKINKLDATTKEKADAGKDFLNT